MLPNPQAHSSVAVVSRCGTTGRVAINSMNGPNPQAIIQTLQLKYTHLAHTPLDSRLGNSAVGDPAVLLCQTYEQDFKLDWHSPAQTQVGVGVQARRAQQKAGGGQGRAGGQMHA